MADLGEQTGLLPLHRALPRRRRRHQILRPGPVPAAVPTSPLPHHPDLVRRLPDRLHGRLHAVGHLPLPARVAGMGLFATGVFEHGHRVGCRRVLERDHGYHRVMPSLAAAVAVTRHPREAARADRDIPARRVRLHREHHPGGETRRFIIFLHRRQLRLRHHDNLVHGRGRCRDSVRLSADLATDHQLPLFAHPLEQTQQRHVSAEQARDHVADEVISSEPCRCAEEGCGYR